MQLSPSASAVLYTVSFHVQVPVSTESRTHKTLTASDVWKGDTMNGLSLPGFFMLVMWLVVDGCNPCPLLLQLNATLNVNKI